MAGDRTLSFGPYRLDPTNARLSRRTHPVRLTPKAFQVLCYLAGGRPGQLGQEAEARAEASEVLRLNPKFSLEVHKQRAPIKDPATLERHLATLRKAGLK